MLAVPSSPHFLPYFYILLAVLFHKNFIIIARLKAILSISIFVRSGVLETALTDTEPFDRLYLEPKSTQAIYLFIECQDIRQAI